MADSFLRRVLITADDSVYRFVLNRTIGSLPDHVLILAFDSVDQICINPAALIQSYDMY